MYLLIVDLTCFSFPNIIAINGYSMIIDLKGFFIIKNDENVNF